MSEPTLKPCAHCGMSDAHINAYHLYTGASDWMAVCRCETCGAQTDARQPSRSAAIDLAAEIWNTPRRAHVPLGQGRLLLALH